MDDDDDKVRKNPNRRVPGPVVKSNYVPEWQRYGYEPIGFQVGTDDFNMHQKRTRQEDPEQQNGSPTDMAPIPEYIPIQPPNTMRDRATNAPESAPKKVSVGTHKNWFEAHIDPQATDPILYEEIPDPPEVEELEVEDEMPEQQEQQEQNEHQDLSDIEPGYYAIFVKGDLIYSSQSSTDIEKVIEDILFDQQETANSVTLDDIILVKRISLKVGVLAMG